MNKCVHCDIPMVKGESELRITVGERVFTNTVPALVCPKCGESYVDHGVASKYERDVALELARNGPFDEATCRFVGKVCGRSKWVRMGPGMKDVEQHMDRDGCILRMIGEMRGEIETQRARIKKLESGGDVWHERFWKVADILEMPGSPSYQRVYDCIEELVRKVEEKK